MQAIEFETVVKNRQVFIPNQYTLNNEKVRVIILAEPLFQKVDSPQKQNSLTSIIAKAKGKACFKSVSQIDEFIRNERNQWD